jgi:hypothetical protein
MNSDPKAELEAGAKILESALAPHGFVFAFQDAGHGSGGDYAWGKYLCGDRSLYLHHRWGLGIVEYHIGDLWIEHSAYLNFLGVERQSDLISLPLESGPERYRALHSDLTRYCGDFIYGPAIDWTLAATENESVPANFFERDNIPKLLVYWSRYVIPNCSRIQRKRC